MWAIGPATRPTGTPSGASRTDFILRTETQEDLTIRQEADNYLPAEALAKVGLTIYQPKGYILFHNNINAQDQIVSLPTTINLITPFNFA